MKRLVIIYSILLMGIGVFAQSAPNQPSNRIERKKQTLDTTSLLHQKMMLTDSVKSEADTSSQKLRSTVPSENVNTKGDTTRLLHRKMMVSPDTLTMSDYTLAIERVNDNLITIGDSAKLGFNVVKISRRISKMTDDVKLIRQNMRGRNTVFNIKNQFLYQSFTARLDEETDQVQAQLDELHQKVYRAKLHLNAVLKDSVFRKLYSNKALRTNFDQRLIRLEKRYTRTDSITKANVDTLNAMNVRLSDNSYNLSNMLNMQDAKMDRALPVLFGNEVNNLWGKEFVVPPAKPSARKQISIFESEQNAIGYYISQTSGERKIVLILGILLFAWLYLKRKLLRKLREEKDAFSYLHIHYLNNHPVLSLVVLLLCLMPFFDAYAPTSYISIFYVFLLIASTVIFFRRGNSTFLFNWLILVALFVSDVIAYFLIEPTFVERLMLLAVHSGIIIFTYRFYRSLNRQMPYFRLLKWAAFTTILLSGIAILFNLYGRFSLAGIVGIAAIFAVTQAVVLTVFVDVIIEIVLLQLQSSRLNKDNDKPFDINIVVHKIKMPLILVAIILWLIMLTSNLNIYHWINASVTDALTITRTIGSISFQWVSVILFIGIIWTAHILQRLLSFFLGETGSEGEDTTIVTKGEHSRLLVTRLLVLIGGYLLAIAASGLPIDKLTFLLGALGIGIGMGLQGIVNNFVSGIILIFDGSLQIGDEIEVSGLAGKVKEIGLRSSTLSTSDGADIIIPNGTILSQNIVNWTYSNNEKRVVISFSLWGEELDANVINEVINYTIKEIEHVISKKKPVILYTKVSTDTCSITVRFWSTTSHGDLVKSQAMLQLSAAFAARKIGFE
ncbi:MAG TPA: mechanosensitive ion channel domain-containing protein [Prolixibacteraceae bacterium]|nr:mechanosensitive ion channel domain-containing protein [Prolixibacteraceae bacterium]